MAAKPCEKFIYILLCPGDTTIKKLSFQPLGKVRYNMISTQQRAVRRREMLAHDKDYLAAVYDKDTTTFQTVITKIQTLSIYTCILLHGSAGS